MDAVRAAIREGVAGVLHALAEWVAPEEWDEDDEAEEWDDEADETAADAEEPSAVAGIRPVLMVGRVGITSHHRRPCCMG